ncbi:MULTISPECIES: hypothetical protein [Vibrio]|uniref:hypothetical protein n=1 Tax=Vibrio TaxID=662 RepID=UPI00078C1CFE|nr:MULTISPECIES: hypothetical protein [Vibrio]BAU70860.1 hypothetical protein [Vibrio sp. 04Ya108]BBM67571.1 hypothetical protein VA249_42170 [Vibrio alfacsensis]BCN27054.1 hypothetical protein VYA_42460 [Vibrio alfacsensis]
MIDFQISNTGLLINLHCILWSEYEEKFADLNKLETTPEFVVKIEDDKVPLKEYVTKMVGETHARCKVIMGKNFINNYMSEDLEFWQEEETQLGNDKSIVELITDGGLEPLDCNYHAETHKYYCNATYPILINFESVNERNRAVTDNRYLNWISRKLLGNIQLQYKNSPSNIESYPVGLASNDLTVDKMEGLGPFAATLKSIMHGSTNLVHKPFEYLVARHKDTFVMPYVSLMTFQKVMYSESVEYVMNAFMRYLKNFFYLSDMINVIGYQVNVVKGTVADIQDGYTDEQIAEKVESTQVLANLSYEYLIRPTRKVNPNDLTTPTSNVLISDPNVGRFGIVRTCYDENSVPIWKTLHYPTTRQGYHELTVFTKRIESLIEEGNANLTLSHLDLLDSPPEALLALVAE